MFRAFHYPLARLLHMKRLYLSFSNLLVFICLFMDTAHAQQSITLISKWTAQAQFAGYYAAEKMGFYKEEGLDVHVKHPSTSENSFSLLEKGKSQAVIMNLSYAMTEQTSGIRVVNIMQTSQRNSLLLVSHSSLKDASSLQNRKIAIWNHLSDELLNRVAKHYQLNVEWIRFNSGISLFLAGAVDICLIGSYNELPQLAECGMKINESHLLRFADHGYDLPEDGMYVTEEFYSKNPETVRKLVKASIRGWEWVNKHKEEALDIVMEQVRLHNVGTNRYHQRIMLNEILRLQVNKQNGKRTYQLSREDFDQAANILLSDHIQANTCIRYEDFVK